MYRRRRNRIWQAENKTEATIGREQVESRRVHHLNPSGVRRLFNIRVAQARIGNTLSQLSHVNTASKYRYHHVPPNGQPRCPRLPSGGRPVAEHGRSKPPKAPSIPRETIRRTGPSGCGVPSRILCSCRKDKDGSKLPHPPRNPTTIPRAHPRPPH